MNTSDDRQLRQRVMAALEWEPMVDAANIGVAAKDGIVTLTGHVASYAQKLAAEEAVRRVRGAKAIAEEIEVRLPSDKKTADDEIAERALRILSWDTTVPTDEVSIKVERGWVTLSGEVDWQYQRAAAERAVHKLGGVVGVSNLMRVRAKPQPDDVRHRIEDAFRRDAGLEAGRVTISVANGRVTLGGQVHSWQEREAAERAAWSAPGVYDVEDRIEVS